MAFFTDSEYRLLLAAIAREKEICKKVMKDSGDVAGIDLNREMSNIETKIHDLQYRKETAVSRDPMRTIAITDGMSEDCIIIMTDASNEEIDHWCQTYSMLLESGKTETPELFYELKKSRNVSIMYDSSIDNMNPMDVRETVCNADEVFDLSAYEGTLVVYDIDRETPVSIIGPFVRADWYRAGEGICGDYDPLDPDDVELLRFDIYYRENPFSDEWLEVEDASYCTQIPADTPEEILAKKLNVIYERYAAILESDPEQSVKKMGEELSWISL